MTYVLLDVAVKYYVLLNGAVKFMYIHVVSIAVNVLLLWSFKQNKVNGYVVLFLFYEFGLV